MLNAQITFIPLGIVPAVVKKRVLKPRRDDMAKLVLPGGGDLASRIWAGIKVQSQSSGKMDCERCYGHPCVSRCDEST